ncbi:MAG: methionine ABC transporter ATP-binding protein [Cardiobacteriaceae bacterium]|nr:methionine ABC transporter ATP-binding protein [Cardiobacteriaceae bacterium]
MIKLRNISKTYQSKNQQILALDGINLEVKEGEIFGVIGESGAGKSSLIRCVNLLERPDSGEVIINGENLLTLDKAKLFSARHKIGMIFQHFNLLANRTVFENISLPLELLKQNKSDIKKRIDELLDLTGLKDKGGYFPAQLSGGQKQRVAIARALASNPKVLLSDEATSALDPKTTENILQLIAKINKELGLTVLMITHEMEVVKSICHKVALIDKGKIIETNRVADFFNNPLTEIAKAFVRQSEKFNLPDFYQKNIHSTGDYPIIKLHYRGQIIDKPLLSLLTRKFNIDTSILQAKIEHFDNKSDGIIIVELIAEKENIAAGIEYLQGKNLDLEVLGYVRKNI